MAFPRISQTLATILRAYQIKFRVTTQKVVLRLRKYKFQNDKKRKAGHFHRNMLSYPAKAGDLKQAVTER